MTIELDKLAADVDTSIARIDTLISKIEADKKQRAADAAAADQREVKPDPEPDKTD